MVRNIVMEGAGKMSFVPGAIMTLCKSIRIIPDPSDPDGYFAGEKGGKRNKGDSIAPDPMNPYGKTLDPPAQGRVLKRLGGDMALVQFRNVDKPVKVHINKFDPNYVDPKRAASKSAAAMMGQMDQSWMGSSRSSNLDISGIEPPPGASSGASGLSAGDVGRGPDPQERMNKELYRQASLRVAFKNASPGEQAELRQQYAQSQAAYAAAKAERDEALANPDAPLE